MTPYFKYSDSGTKCMATPLYTGEFDETFFKIKFHDQYWFDREIKYLEVLQAKNYVPDIVYIDMSEQEILLELNGKNLNHMIYEKDDLPSDWIDQINFILRDLEADNIFKLNLYPHTFYVNNSTVKLLDFYACGNEEDSVSHEMLKDIINDKDRFKFKGEYLDFESTYKQTIKNQLHYWPEKIIND